MTIALVIVGLLKDGGLVMEMLPWTPRLLTRLCVAEHHNNSNMQILYKGQCAYNMIGSGVGRYSILSTVCIGLS